ncbi:MAG: hypothetical protein ABIO70_07035 [Pseudomonadota bacterium]
MRHLAPLALALAGCHVGYDFVPQDDTLTLDLTSPQYGAFLGDEDILVEGRATPVGAIVRVEGEEVDAADHGAFRASLGVDGPYRIVEVEAEYGGQYLRERVPVFSGHDPADTWPEGITGRLLPSGLTAIGGQLGAVIDDTGWVGSITAVMPAYDGGIVAFEPIGASASPTVVVLSPTEGGIDAGIALNDLTLAYEVVVDLYGYTWSETISFAYGLIQITALATPRLDDEGIIWIDLSETGIALDEPDADFGLLEGWVVEWILELANDWITEPLGEWLLDMVLDEWGTFELGGPFAFDQDLMGTRLAVELASLGGDPQGLALGLGVGLDTDPPEGGPLMAMPGVDDAPEGQAVLGLHEGLLDLVVSGSVLDMLDQGMDLTGFMGDMVGGFITNLPGGDEAPEGDGWCVGIQPGEAHVVRLQEGIDPLAVLYLPDLRMDIEVLEGSHCEPWLQASLAVEVGITAKDDGTVLGMDLNVAEGAVLSYGAEDWDEDEVVAGLGGFLETVMSLLGGGFEIDLSELLGGSTELLPGMALSPRLVDSARLEEADGTWTEGLYAVSLDVFAE